MEKVKGKFFSEIIKGVLTSEISMLIGVITFSIIVSIAGLNGTVVKTVNQFLKVVSIFLGCFVCLKEGMGFLKGVVIGVVFAILSYVIFMIFGVQPTWGLSFIIEIVFLSVIGAICGTITVNVKQKG